MADEPPTQTLLDAATAVEQKTTTALPGWEDFKAKQLPAINDLLRKAGRPAIDLAKAATDLPDSGDEE
jgi:hypothetical protein